MLLFRFAGAALLIIGGWSCSAYFNRRTEGELDSAEAAVSLLRFVKNEVECFSLPVSDIMRKCPRELLSAFGYREPSADSLEAFVSGADISDRETERILREFSSEFGKCYREEQVKRCEHYISRLEGRRLELNGQLPAKKRISSTLFLSGSCALAILLF